jgi:phytoene desaturase
MKKYDIAVIGSGFGGLSSALTLQSMGLSVALIDALDKAGGRAYVEHKNGYYFDRGPSIITAPFLIDDIFSMSGANRSDYCSFVPVDPYYKVVFHDDSSISHFNSHENFLKEIERECPEDIAGVIKFFEHADKIFKKGFIELGDKNFSNIFSMLGVAPHLLKLNAVRPVYSMVSKFVKNEKVRQFLSFHPLLIGGNPFGSAAVYSLINRLERAYGVFHPIGGMGNLVQAFVKRFQEIGGELFLSSAVEKVEKNINQEFEIFCKDKSFLAKKLIVNGDMHHFVNDILQNKSQPKRLLKKLNRSKYSMSAFLMYFGTNKQWSHMPQHTIVLGPRYEDLLKDIFIKKVEFDDFSFYLHMPTRTDPSLAPAGGEVIYALVPVPNLSSGTDWEKYKLELSEKLKDTLEARFLPGLRNSIMEESIFTPVDFQTTLRSHLGNAFGLEPSLLQSAGFRPSNKSAEIDNLYFVGANTQPGAGLPGVLLSSRITCKLLLEDMNLEHNCKLISQTPSAFTYVNQL